MDKRALLLKIVAVCVIAAAAMIESGCSPQAGSHGQTGSYPQLSPLEKECERELLYLDSLIDSVRRAADGSTAVMAEAEELRRSAMELMLDEEFELALELIDEAIALLSPHV